MHVPAGTRLAPPRAWICSLSCSGAEALAIIVGVTGVVGITIGAIFVIRAILGRKRKKQTSKVSAG